jgi:hypothetical protein
MISVATITNKQSPSIYKNIFNNYINQSYINKELILIINITDSINNRINELLNELLIERCTSKLDCELIKKSIKIHNFPGNTLGDCLNKSAELAIGEYWSKFDDDDKYGCNYLENSIMYLTKSGADIVGKRRIFVEDKQTNSLYLTNSRNLVRPPNHKFTDFIRGPTFFCKRILVLQIQFPNKNEGEDSEFLRRCTRARRRIFTTDENDFVYIRNSEIGQTSRMSIKQVLGNNATKLN